MTEEEYDNAVWILDQEGEISFGTEESAQEFYKMLSGRETDCKYKIVPDPSSFGNFLVMEDFSETKVTGVIECDCCGGFHKEDYVGFQTDCRNDNERFASLEDAEERIGGKCIEVVEIFDDEDV